MAVVKELGTAKEIRTSGTYFDFWITKNYEKYDTRVQTLDIVESAYSKDAQTMDTTMTIQYQIDPSKAIEIATTYGGLDVLSSRIRSVAIEKTKSVLSAYSAMSIIETRSTISPEVEKVVKEAVDNNYHVTINTVVLTNIDFSDAFEKTVEDKMIAEQQKLQAEYEAEKKKIEAEAAAEVARIEAEMQVKVAKAKAEAAIAKANGDAEAQKVIAAAEAYSAQVKIVELARSLGYTVTETDETVKIEWGEDATGKKALLAYLQYLEYLAKWNGKLPDVIAGDNSILIPTPVKP